MLVLLSLALTPFKSVPPGSKEQINAMMRISLYTRSINLFLHVFAAVLAVNHSPISITGIVVIYIRVIVVVIVVVVVVVVVVEVVVVVAATIALAGAVVVVVMNNLIQKEFTCTTYNMHTSLELYFRICLQKCYLSKYVHAKNSTQRNKWHIEVQI